MRKVSLLVALSVLGTLVFASAALASFGTTVGGRPAQIPEYQVTKDGMLVIGGDVMTPCRELLQGRERILKTTAPTEQAGVRRAFQKEAAICTAKGFPPSQPIAKVRSEQRLPDTGGPPLLPAFAATTLATLGLAGLLLVRSHNS